MKNLFSLIFAVTSILCLYSCSKKDTLQIIFPLGISVEEVMSDELISSKKALSHFFSEQEIKEGLTKNYELNERGRGSIHKEDNFKDVNDLENVTGLAIKDYIKDGILYNEVFLFFKNNKLIQVYADTENEDNVSLVNLKLANFPEYRERVFEQTYHWGDETSTSTYNALQYKISNVHFEIQNENENRTYYTYYTIKVLPLFGVDY